MFFHIFLCSLGISFSVFSKEKCWSSLQPCGSSGYASYRKNGDRYDVFPGLGLDRSAEVGFTRVYNNDEFAWKDSGAVFLIRQKSEKVKTVPCLPTFCRGINGQNMVPRAIIKYWRLFVRSLRSSSTKHSWGLQEISPYSSISSCISLECYCLHGIIVHSS